MDGCSQGAGLLRLPPSNYPIDVRCGVIMDVEASRAFVPAEARRLARPGPCWSAREVRFGLKPQRLAADSAYGSAPMLNWLVEGSKQIAPHIPDVCPTREDP